MKGEIFLRMLNRDASDSPPVALSHLDMASFNLLNEMAVQKTQNPDQSHGEDRLSSANRAESDPHT